MLAIRWILALAGALAAPAPDVPPNRIPLELKEWAGVARAGEPICCGVPLPRGFAKEADEVVLVDEGGEALPTQRSVLARWQGDRSIRWLLVQGPLSCGAGQTRRLFLERRASVPVASGLAVADDGERVTVNTGPLELELRRRRFRLPNRASLDADGDGRCESELLRDTGPSLTITDADGKPIPGLEGDDVALTVEETGPYRAVVRCQRADRDGLEGQVDFIARLYAYAGKPHVRIELTLINVSDFGDTADGVTPNRGVRRVCRIAYRLWPELGAVKTARFGVEDDGASAEVPGGGLAMLRQPEAHSFTISRGTPDKVTSRGAHGTGWLALEAAAGSLLVSCKWFWQQYPKALCWDPHTGELALDLWAEGGKPLVSADGNLEWYPGQAKTHDILLWFGAPGQPMSAVARAAVLSQQRAPLRLFPPPEAVLATDATDTFAVESWERWPTFEARARSQMLYSRIGWYFGMMDFGDQACGGSPPPVVAWWNGYHATGHCWFNYYARSADPRFFEGLEIAEWHRQDVDIMHWPPRQAGMHHLAYYKGTDHHWGHLDWPGCQWIQGLADYYLLTGSLRTLEVLTECGDWLVRHLQFAPHRTTSITLIALSACYQATGKPEYLDACKQLADYLCTVVDEGTYVPKSFMIAHMIDGMYQYWRITRDPRVAEQLAKQTRWLYTECVTPGGMPYYARTGSESDANSWSVYYSAPGEMVAACAQAYRVTGDPQFVEYGKQYLDYVLAFEGDNLGGMVGHTDHGLPQMLWAMEQLGLDERAITHRRDDIDYDAAIAELKTHRADGGGIELEVARLLITLERYEQAIGWMTETMLGDGTNLTALSNIARCHEAMGDLQAAIGAYRKVIRLTEHIAPGGPPVGLQPWEVAAAMGGYSNAWRAWAKLATLYEQQGQFRRAADCYEMASRYGFSGARERFARMVDRRRDGSWLAAGHAYPKERGGARAR